MMKWPLVVVSSLFSLHTVFAEALPVVSPQAVGLSAAKLEAVDAIAEEMVSEGKLAGCVIAVARHGKIAYLKAFGTRDLDAGTPMATDTVFRIYSMSKAVTTAVALMLVDDGRLKLDAPVADYLPELAGLKVHESVADGADARAMTVRDLMRHTAGLTYGLFGDSEVDKLYQEKDVLDESGSLADMTKKLGELPLLYEPGARWVYSIAG